MEMIIKHIKLDEVSYNVNLLHKALKALGYSVAKKEVKSMEAGKSTLKHVRKFQASRNLPVDDTLLVNEDTAITIARALKERGLTTASKSFTVSGTAFKSNGEVKKRQKLIALDLDLRGVAVYREINSIAEIKKNGGFEFLGESVSDNLGNYRFTFYDWQYGEAERKKADVVVYAIEGEEIVGHSSMVNSEDYSEKGLVRNLDVVITKEEVETEYDILMGRLGAFLKESKYTLSKIATSRDQLVFTAGELDEKQSRIEIAASAELLVKPEEKDISHELLYGIGRQNIRLSWDALYKKQEEELRGVINKSIKERIIRKFKEQKISDFLQTIHKCAAEQMLDDSEARSGNTLNAMLTNALPKEKQKLSFVNALSTFKGSNFKDFWNEHLPGIPEFYNGLGFSDQ